MPTYTALTTLTGQQAADALGAAMEHLVPEPTGVGVFEIEDGSGLWEVGGYFVEEPDHAGLALLAAMHGAKDFVVSELPEVDWVSKVRRELSPVEAGRFFVYGSHDADKVPEGAVSLLIEAAMAFGTGHHGTTLGCLRALDRLMGEGFTGQNVIDVGCGTAVLAMAAAKVWPGTVLASDIDEVAVEVARTNVATNGLDGRVQCIEAAGFDALQIASAAPFDLIFANILKGPLIALMPEIAQNLKQGGFAIISGILNEQVGEILHACAENRLSVHGQEEIGDWTTICLRPGNA